MKGGDRAGHDRRQGRPGRPPPPQRKQPRPGHEAPRGGAPHVLTVAGADPSAASGVYRDIATLGALGCAGLAAITSITAQNTSRFGAAEAASPAMISRQIGAVFGDFEVAAVKIGMVYDGDSMAAVRAALLRGMGRQARKSGKGRIPVVVDPVVRSTTGGRLLDPRSLGRYRESIVPLATAITPNVHELGVLAGRRALQASLPHAARPAAARARAAADGEIEEAARAVLGMGAAAVVVTGISDGRLVRDMVYEPRSRPRAASRGLPAAGGERRGSGCTHSAALAALLASGLGLAEAARGAAAVAHRSVHGAAALGAGLPVAAAARMRRRQRRSNGGDGGDGGGDAGRSGGREAGRLDAAAESFASIRNIGRHIPECQTNIAYAPRPASLPRDVLGLDGRIVSTMSGGAAVAGRAARGASRHVAAAVVEASSMFPAVRAAANIRYAPGTVGAARALGMSVRSYDRDGEPAAVRDAEGASVPWGVRAALRGARRQPDAIYHTGAHGKEPMIVVLGTSPRDVVSKVRRIAAASPPPAGRPRRLIRRRGAASP